MLTRNQELSAQWRPLRQELGEKAGNFLAERGDNKLRWQPFLERNPDLAKKLGVDVVNWDSDMAQSLSYFYHYHVIGDRKQRDLERRQRERAEQAAGVIKPRRHGNAAQRAKWREQKRESLARIAARITRTPKPIVSRREDVGLPPLEASNNGPGLRASLVRTIEQLQSLLKAIE